MRNANTPIGHNIAFLRNTFGTNIVNYEITQYINLQTVHLTIEQHVLLSNFKMFMAVRNGNATLPYLSSYDRIFNHKLIDIVFIAIFHQSCLSYVLLYQYCDCK